MRPQSLSLALALPISLYQGALEEGFNSALKSLQAPLPSRPPFAHKLRTSVASVAGAFFGVSPTCRVFHRSTWTWFS